MDKRRNKIGLAPDKPRISNEELSEFTIINVLAIILMILGSSPYVFHGPFKCSSQKALRVDTLFSF